MAIITSEEARDLSDKFLELAKETGDFLHDNLTVLSEEDEKRLDELTTSLLGYGENMIVLSTIVVGDEVRDSLEQINDITDEIKGNIKKLHDVQKGIDLTAAIVTLAASLFSKNPKAILSALGSLRTAWNDIKKQ